MGLGSGPFGGTPLGGPSGNAGSDTLAALHSSRKIDAHGRYVLDDDGGFEGMDDTAQRVLLAVSFASVDLPKIVTPQASALGEAKIRAALKPLTSGSEPAIKLEVARIERSAPGTVRVVVIFKNLLTGTSSSVEKSI
jgi:hypothetical protein